MTAIASNPWGTCGGCFSLLIRVLLDFSRRTNLNHGISVLIVDSVVSTNPIEIYYVLEVPADEHICTTQGSNGNVLAIRPARPSDNTCFDVLIRQNCRILGKLDLKFDFGRKLIQKVFHECWGS